MASKKKISRKTNGNGAIPAGFRKVERPHISGFWIPEIEGQSVRGIVQDLVRMTGPDGNPNIWYHLMLTSNKVGGNVIGYLDATRTKKGKLDVGEGEIVGVSGAVLIALLRDHEGKEVICKYTGLGEKKKGKNQARLYDVFTKE